MLLIPYRVDVPFDRKPIVNCILVASIVFVFLLQLYWMYIQPEGFEGDEDVASPFDPYVLDGWTARGLLGNMWLHGGILHLAGNMLFLWLFGNAVCQKVGNWMYLPLYLTLGFLASASHLIFMGGRAVGASGAINGIVGMFLVFFPTNDMDVLFVFFIPYTLTGWIRTFSVSSFWMILLWFFFDILGAVFSGQGIAYFAHIGGFVSGFVIAVVLLKFKAVTMEQDELSLLQILNGERWSDVRGSASSGGSLHTGTAEGAMASDSKNYRKFLTYQQMGIESEIELDSKS